MSVAVAHISRGCSGGSKKKKKGKKGTIAAVVRLKQYGNKKSRKSVRPRALCCSAHREQFI